MPQLQLTKTCLSEKQVSLFFWHITESEEELLSMDAFTSASVPSFEKKNLCGKRLKEKLAVRILLHQVAHINSSICYRDSGLPYLSNDRRHISISHSHDYAALAIADNPIGMDIEVWGERAYRLSRKFLSPEELNLLETDDPIRISVLLWSAKEAVFKRFGDHRLTVGNDIRITSCPEGLCGHLPGNVQTKLQYAYFPQFVLTYTRD